MQETFMPTRDYQRGFNDGFDEGAAAMAAEIGREVPWFPGFLVIFSTIIVTLLVLGVTGHLQ